MHFLGPQELLEQRPIQQLHGHPSGEGFWGSPALPTIYARFLSTVDNKRYPRNGKPYAERVIDHIVADNWPFGPPLPAIYYDPQGALPGPPWVSLHAKCIVVDDTFSFVSSANFTGRGQTRNIEVGVCIEDRDFAERLAQQRRALVSRSLVARWGA